jgi:hypothetical protein
MSAMKNTFYQTIKAKEGRRILIKAGFRDSTVTLWAQGKRKPEYETALKLAKLLRLPIKSVPWTRTITNTPKD